MHGALQGHHLDFMRVQTYGTNCVLRLVRSLPNTPRDVIAEITSGYHIQGRPTQKDADENQASRLWMAADAVTDSQRTELSKCTRVEFDVDGQEFVYEVGQFPPMQIAGSGWDVVLKQINAGFSG